MPKHVEPRLRKLEAQLAHDASASRMHQRPRIVGYDASASPEDLEARNAFFAAQLQAVTCACGQPGCPEVDGPVIFLPHKGDPRPDEA